MTIFYNAFTFTEMHPAKWQQELHKGDYFKKSGVLLSMEEMRDLWGQQKIESEPTEQLN